MDHLYKKLGIPSHPYTEYFLNEFSENNKQDMIAPDGLYKVFLQNTLNDPYIKKIEDELISKYNFPAIDYFLVFKHHKIRPIHIDGAKDDRHACLNLPMSGYEPTSIEFFKQLPGTTPIIRDSKFFKTSDVEYIDKLDGSNEWVLINCGIPHRIKGPSYQYPRTTISMRFKDNPKYEDLVELIIRSGD